MKCNMIWYHHWYFRRVGTKVARAVWLKTPCDLLLRPSGDYDHDDNDGDGGDFDGNNDGDDDNGDDDDDDYNQ